MPDQKFSDNPDAVDILYSQVKQLTEIHESYSNALNAANKQVAFLESITIKNQIYEMARVLVYKILKALNEIDERKTFIFSTVSIGEVIADIWDHMLEKTNLNITQKHVRDIITLAKDINKRPGLFFHGTDKEKKIIGRLRKSAELMSGMDPIEQFVYEKGNEKLNTTWLF